MIPSVKRCLSMKKSLYKFAALLLPVLLLLPLSAAGK